MNSTEIWVKIKGTKYNYVSSNGRFKLEKPNKEVKYLKTYVGKTGYYNIRMNIDGVSKLCKCHRIIAQHFIENPNNLPQVNHVDGNKLNNSIHNLEWVTNKQNSDHAWANGLIKKQLGEKATKSKLKEKDVFDILNSKLSISELAKIYNVHKSSIDAIRKGKNWSWLTNIERKYKTIDGEKILKIFNDQRDAVEIAKSYCVSRQFVSSIKIGKKYSNITGKNYVRKNKNRVLFDAEKILNIYNSKLSIKECCVLFCASESFIRKIKNGKIYNSITNHTL